jgi:predicted RNA-binding protein with EMAP domain
MAARNKDAYVQLEELVQFNKMKQIGATTENAIEALKDGEFKSFEYYEGQVRK